MTKKTHMACKNSHESDDLNYCKTLIPEYYVKRFDNDGRGGGGGLNGNFTIFLFLPAINTVKRTNSNVRNM